MHPIGPRSHVWLSALTREFDATDSFGWIWSVSHKFWEDKLCYVVRCTVERLWVITFPLSNISVLCSVHRQCVIQSFNVNKTQIFTCWLQFCVRPLRLCAKGPCATACIWIQTLCGFPLLWHQSAQSASLLNDCRWTQSNCFTFRHYRSSNWSTV